jgi:hypothetical protein
VPPRCLAKLTLTLGHGSVSWKCLAGRSALPLEPGDGGHRGMPRGRQGQAAEPTKPVPCINSPTMGRLRSRVGWWSACGWGSGMPAPSGQIPPPRAWWENEAPATRAARRPVPGNESADDHATPMAVGRLRRYCRSRSVGHSSATSLSMRTNSRRSVGVITAAGKWCDS